MTALAYNFKSDGLYYNILSEEDRTVEVTYYRNDGYYSYYNDAYGDIEIPSKLIYDHKTYKVTSIGKYAFFNCSGLTSVTIPNSVTSIGTDAFFNCSGLTSVTIPNSVTSISHAFDKCSRLISIIVDESNPSYSSIEGILYNNDATTLIYCPNAKKTVTIPNSVTSIGGSAFYNCSGLTSVTIGNSVTSIGGSAFYNCSGLT
ncbi:leucine-rich repeat domain-containing protein, partial [Muribaculum intestinale]|uniref:leucine-rich repeat domain-containing protein n=1 Tax=Muribaculum intestinale TaxID=1796646 RepID=UPI0024952FA9